MSLLHLVNASLINPGDEIFFYFKDKYYLARVDQLGMICKTTCNEKPIFLDKLPFDNLTEWADACIQEISMEYITRFSAWKRCTHRNSGLILNNLRQLCNIFSVPKIPVTNATITTLQQTISMLLSYSKALEEQNNSMRQYIYAERDEFDEEPIHLPKGILTVAKLYDKYLVDKATIELKATKNRKKPRLEKNNALSDCKQLQKQASKMSLATDDKAFWHLAAAAPCSST